MAGLCRPSGVGGVPGTFQGECHALRAERSRRRTCGMPGLCAAPVLGLAAQMNTKAGSTIAWAALEGPEYLQPRESGHLPCMARSGFGHAPKKSPPGKEAQNTSVFLWVTTARHADSRGSAAGRCKNMCARISLCEIPCLQGILKLNKQQVYCRAHRIHLEYLSHPGRSYGRL